MDAAIPRHIVYISGVTVCIVSKIAIPEINHPPPAPPPPRRRRRDLHPTLPNIQAGTGDPHPPAAGAADGGGESRGSAASTADRRSRPKIAFSSATVTGYFFVYKLPRRVANLRNGYF